MVPPPEGLEAGDIAVHSESTRDDVRHDVVHDVIVSPEIFARLQAGLATIEDVVGSPPGPAELAEVTGGLLPPHQVHRAGQRVNGRVQEELEGPSL